MTPTRLRHLPLAPPDPFMALYAYFEIMVVSSKWVIWGGKRGISSKKRSDLLKKSSPAGGRSTPLSGPFIYAQ